MRRLGLAGGLLAALAAPLAAERLDGPTPGLIGLVAPAIVADGPTGCLRVDTHEVLSLRSGPGGEHPRIGWLQFRPWRAESGECDEAQPFFIDPGQTGSRPVPTLERGYEEPALLLLAQQGDWLRIDLGGRSGWLRRPGGYTVERYPDLLADKLAFATEAWTGELCESAGGRCRQVVPAMAQSLQMLSTRQVGETHWIEVELTTNPCGDEKFVPLERGWIRSHDDAGRPAVWFHSRGC